MVKSSHADDAEDAAAELMAWISINGAGKVTIFNHRSEMGQGTWQSIPQIIAEELEVNMDQVTIRFAAANAQKYGPQPQEGSFSTGEAAGLASDYYRSIPHYSFGNLPTKSPIPTMWWRAPVANTDAFASESFIDELAHLASQDPLEFRKKHLTSERYQALVNKLAAISSWSSRAKNGGWGVAITECFGSMVGQAVKVSRRADKGIRIDKVYALIDCGWYVNPDIIRAQLEGSIIMALGATVNHATHFKDGKAVESNFHNYPMPRMNEIPEIAVHIMENHEKPGGVGEPGLPAFAPALCNAIFDLTGKRIRKVPFRLEEV